MVDIKFNITFELEAILERYCFVGDNNNAAGTSHRCLKNNGDALAQSVYELLEKIKRAE